MYIRNFKHFSCKSNGQNWYQVGGNNDKVALYGCIKIEIKCSASLALYLFSSTRLINSIKWALIIRSSLAGTWRQNNDVSTSMRRHDVALTPIRRCIKVVCLLGLSLVGMKGYFGPFHMTRPIENTSKTNKYTWHVPITAFILSYLPFSIKYYHL